jgi:hypothetical protein
MHQQTQDGRTWFDIVSKTDQGNQAKTQYKPGIGPAKEKKVEQGPQKKNQAPTPYGNSGMRAALVGFVYDVEATGNLKIQQFGQYQYGDDQEVNPHDD